MQLSGDGSPGPANGQKHFREATRYRSQRCSEPPLDGRSGLDLSMHFSREPFGNRFDVLREHSSPLRRPDLYESRNRRRSRYKRGTKGGKRRRDARKHLRRLAATQLLDDQLAGVVNKTMGWPNVRKPRLFQSFSEATSGRLANGHTLQDSTSAPPTPWELPYLNFGGLDLVDEQPEPTAIRSSSSLSTPRPPFPRLPSWCPDLPSLVSDSAKADSFPMFFDLSNLPEPLETLKPPPRCQELQLWQPTVKQKPRQQSKIHPLMTRRKIVDEASTTDCKLHHSDRVVQDAATQTIPDTSKLKSKAEVTDVGGDGNDRTNNHPANLWQILCVPQKGDQVDHYHPCVDSFAYQPAEDRSTSRHSALNPLFEAVATPSEIDSKEIPYVHGNSLTGYANDRATFVLPDCDGRSVIFDSPPKEMLGLNELVVDQLTEKSYSDAVLNTLDLPASDPSPILEATVPPDAQFQSEQALFQPPPPVIRPADDEVVDIATFLKTTHPPNCWCEVCCDPSELIYLEDDSEDEEWMDLSTLCRVRSSSVSSTSEDEWEECPLFWDDFPICTPSSVVNGAW